MTFNSGDILFASEIQFQAFLYRHPLCSLGPLAPCSSLTCLNARHVYAGQRQTLSLRFFPTTSASYAIRGKNVGHGVFLEFRCHSTYLALGHAVILTKLSPEPIDRSTRNKVRCQKHTSCYLSDTLPILFSSFHKAGILFKNEIS